MNVSFQFCLADLLLSTLDPWPVRSYVNRNIGLLRLIRRSFIFSVGTYKQMKRTCQLAEWEDSKKI
jgi:hypothetical protein